MTTQPHATAQMRARPRSDQEVDALVFWRWVWQSIHPVLGWVFVALGLVAIGLGWWGVSRTPIVAKQLPYLASGGLAGVALVVLGGRFMVIRDLRQDSGRLDRLEQMVAELHSILLTGAQSAGLLDTDAAVDGARAAGEPTFLVLPDGERYHRPGCPMVEGKDDVSRVRTSTITRRGLAPCPLCEPVGAGARG